MTTPAPHTCQICERALKTPGGLISHHGYQRPGWGFQTASCIGARRRPYEEACDAIEELLALLKPRHAGAVAHLSEPIVEVTVVLRRAFKGGKFEDVLGTLTEATFEEASQHPGWMSANYRLRTWGDVVEKERAHRAQVVAQLAHDIAHFRARLAAWHKAHG